ncbi:MAG: GNAT family N-acetyltransferase [Patescibacteria group bacterium]|nr:GNAT family N-acetyltransferase [Patescibacteria group bacterium]
MKENPLENKKSKQEKLAVKIEMATKEDWETYKALKLASIDASDDIEMLGMTQKDIETQKNKTDEGWKTELAPNNLKFILLAFNGPEAIGAISAKQVEAEDKIWYIYGSYIKPEFRRMGLGENILAICLDDIELRGGTKATMRVNEKNEKQFNLIGKFFFKVQRPQLLWGEYVLETDLTDERVIKKIKEVLNAR